jgi:hypothetical protein
MQYQINFKELREKYLEFTINQINYIIIMKTINSKTSIINQIKQ